MVSSRCPVLGEGEETREDEIYDGGKPGSSSVLEGHNADEKSRVEVMIVGPRRKGGMTRSKLVRPTFGAGKGAVMISTRGEIRVFSLARGLELLRY